MHGVNGVGRGAWFPVRKVCEIREDDVRLQPVSHKYDERGLILAHSEGIRVLTETDLYM